MAVLFRKIWKKRVKMICQKTATPGAKEAGVPGFI
jgi:hypothetical protein